MGDVVGEGMGQGQEGKQDTVNRNILQIWLAGWPGGHL